MTEKKAAVGGAKNWLLRIRQASTFNIFLILLGMCVILALLAGGKFLSVSNITSVVRQFSFYAIMSGHGSGDLTGIDLSVGSVAFSGIITCMGIMRWGVPAFLGAAGRPLRRPFG